MKKVYCLGSSFEDDEQALTFVGKTLEGFKFVKYTGEIEKHMLIMDVVKGVDKVQVLPLDSFMAEQRITAHDLDYGMELMLRKEVGDIKVVKVICLPYGVKVTEDELCSVLKNV